MAAIGAVSRLLQEISSHLYLSCNSQSPALALASRASQDV